MSTDVARVTPSWPAVAFAQLRMLLQLQRRDFLIVGGIGAVLFGLALWGLTKVPVIQTGDLPRVPIFQGVAYMLIPVALVWPLGTWRHDPPERRGYFWSLPVARGPHTLLRVGVGWLLLMYVCFAVMLLSVLVGLLYTLRVDGLQLTLAHWYLPLTAATLAYVLISVLAVLVDNPIRVVIWGLAGLMGILVVSEITDSDNIERLLEWLTTSLGSALAGPDSELVLDNMEFSALSLPLWYWSAHYLGWLIPGLLAIGAGAYLHRDAK